MRCCFQKQKNDKMRCIVHNQSLAYIYALPKGGYGFICQAGEDEAVEEVHLKEAKR